MMAQPLLATQALILITYKRPGEKTAWAKIPVMEYLLDDGSALKFVMDDVVEVYDLLAKNHGRPLMPSSRGRDYMFADENGRELDDPADFPWQPSVGGWEKEFPGADIKRFCHVRLMLRDGPKPRSIGRRARLRSLQGAKRGTG